MEKNVLAASSREAFRAWLMEHAGGESECWVRVKRGRPDSADVF